MTPESALVKKTDEATIEVTLGRHFSVGPTGLTVRGAPSFDEWAQLGHALRVMEKGIQFAIGDFLLYGEERFSERASQIIDAEMWSESTVKVYRWVSERVPLQNRRMDLSYSHHQAVASLAHSEQKHWLGLAAESGDTPWSVSRLKTAIRYGGDIEPTGWFLLVACDSEDEAKALSKKLSESGYAVKEMTSRKQLSE